MTDARRCDGESEEIDKVLTGEDVDMTITDPGAAADVPEVWEMEGEIFSGSNVLTYGNVRAVCVAGDCNNAARNGSRTDGEADMRIAQALIDMRGQI